MELYCVVMISTIARSNEIPVLQRTRAVTFTNIVSHTFCESSLPAEEMVGKDTLEEVHTYAELELDPRASFPDSYVLPSRQRVAGIHFGQHSSQS